MITSRSNLLNMRNVPGKKLEKIKIYSMFHNIFRNRAVSDILWENIENRARHR